MNQEMMFGAYFSCTDVYHYCSVLKRNGATRQRVEWHLVIFQAIEVEVYDVPQENLKDCSKESTGATYDGWLELSLRARYRLLTQQVL